jgi:ABC-2 type transport system permease protein
MRTLRAYFDLLLAYMRVNWRASLEYRTNFIFESILSVVEVGMYLFYWRIFLSISSGIPGISYEQLAALVVFNHIIYGGADTLMAGQVWEAGAQIVKGQLDIFLVQPKSAIFQLFFSGAQPMRALQILVGVIVYFFFVPLTLVNVLLLIFGLVTGTLIFTSWVIAIHSITFRLGNSVVIYKLLSVILHFAKKPTSIFSFVIRFILYTIIPAAYIGAVQSQQVFAAEVPVLFGLAALAVVSPVVAAMIFRRGMRLYESGNLIGIRM